MRLLRLIYCVVVLFISAAALTQPTEAATPTTKITVQPVVSPSPGCHSDWCEKVRTLAAVVRWADRSLIAAKHEHSPLRQDLAGIVRASRDEGISPFFLLSIAGKESTFGRAACGYNAWGWNSCKGDDFTSFVDGARKVAHSLRVNYLGKWGLRTIEAVGNTYCGSRCGADWSYYVRLFMDDIFHAGDGLRWQDAVAVVRAR